MLSYDELLAAKAQFAGVRDEARMVEALGLEYTAPVALLLAMAELGLTLCDRYERDALSHPNYPLNR